MGGRDDVDAIRHARRRHSRRSREDLAPRVGGRPGLGTVSRRETSRTRETYLEDGVHRDAPRARPAVRSTAARAAHV